MARLKAVNGAISSLAEICLVGDDHIHLATGEGAGKGFPAAGDYILRVFDSSNPETVFEYMRGTARTTDVISVTRGAGAIEHATGSQVWLAITEEYLEEMQAEMDTHTTLGAQAEVRLTPQASSSGPEGTLFYSSDDTHVWVAREL